MLYCGILSEIKDGRYSPAAPPNNQKIPLEKPEQNFPRNNYEDKTLVGCELVEEEK